MSNVVRKDGFKRTIKIEVSNVDKNLLERLDRESSVAADNVKFMLRLHANDKDDSFLNSEIYNRLLKRQIETSTRFILAKIDIEKKYIPEKYRSISNIEWDWQYSDDYMVVFIPDSYDGEIIESETIEKKLPKYEQFQDYMARLYPELHDDANAERENQLILARSFTFQVTDACNLACTYCYQINKSTRVMKLEDAKKAVDYLLSGDKGFSSYINPRISPALIIEFIGGEPFLQVELIDQIVDYFREQAIILNHPWAEMFAISICSNGVLYFDEKVQKFMKKNERIMSFSITIDGNKELHDSCRVFPDGKPSYDIAVAGAQDWMNRGNYMGSKITIAPGNIDYLYDAIMHMVDLGYWEINANCVYEEGWTTEHATKLYYQMKRIADEFIEKNYIEEIYCSLFRSENLGYPKTEDDVQNWCGGTGAMLSMDPVGGLYPCIRYMESSLGNQQPPLAIGHIDVGLGTTCEWANCINCLDKIDRRTQSTDECFYCPIAEGCSWCSGYNYQVFGTADKRATFICIMHKARVMANSYYWNKYYRKINSEERISLHIPEEWALEIIDKNEFEMLKTLAGK